MEYTVKANKRVKNTILEVAEVANYLWQNGWAERNAGNISVNLNNVMKEEVLKYDTYAFFDLPKPYSILANSYFFVTGTGKRMRDLARKPLKNALIIRLNDKGNGYWIISQNKKSLHNFMPTSELPTHLGIHEMILKRGSNEKVVMHTHANELVALTQNREFCNEKIVNTMLWGMHPETMVFVPKGVGFVPYILPGTEEIATATIKALKNHDVALWEKHGVFAIGESVLDTFDIIDILVKSAKIYFISKQGGFEPEGLNEKQLDDLRELVKKFSQ